MDGSIIAIVSFSYFFALVGVCIYTLLTGLITESTFFWGIRRVKKLQKQWAKSATSGQQFKFPLVSIIATAKDEEHNIGAFLESVVHQDYPHYEVLVMDHLSSDKTGEIIRSYQEKYPHLVKFIKGIPAPLGSNPKAVALAHVGEFAKGEFLFILDVDIRLKPGFLQYGVASFAAHKVDFFSAVLELEPSFANHVFHGMQCFTITAFFPLPLTYVVPNQAFAMGPVLGCRRSVYQAIGGFASVADKPLLDDMLFANRAKSMGYKIFFADMKQYARLCSFHSSKEGINSLSRNIYWFLKENIFIVLAMLIFVFLFYLMPLFLPIVLFLSGLTSSAVFWSLPIVPYVAWILLIYWRRYKLRYVFYWPLALMGTIAAAVYACFNVITGKGFSWKGHALKNIVKETNSIKSSMD